MKKYLQLPAISISLLLIVSLSTSLQAAPQVSHLSVDIKTHYRDSEDLAVAAPFPPNTFQRTVDPGHSGDHLEISKITLSGKVQFTEYWQMLSKIDAFDFYERNPTTSDKKLDIDTLIVRYGTRHTHGALPEEISYYGQIGKFGRFERQEDRHLESYGLVSTAFNRLEDTGIELGLDFPMGFYGKLAYTTGTPVFFRDPNALAGDNGVEFSSDPENPQYNSGMLILYDAEVEEFDLNENPETSIGLGYRWLSDEGTTRVNVLVHHDQRDMAESIALEGTGYGADLDLLVVLPDELPPGTINAPVGLPITNDKKEESGATLWLYHNHFALFAQVVNQGIAGLKRSGREIELSYLFEDVPLFESITPAFRYSKLDPDYTTAAPFPAMSVTWEWDKVDAGVDFKINDNFNLVIEHSENEFIRQGKSESYGESLVTLGFKYDLKERFNP